MTPDLGAVLRVQYKDNYVNICASFDLLGSSSGSGFRAHGN